MASPPRLRGLTREAFPDAPEWWSRVLGILSPFFLDTTNALTKGLTRKENMVGDASEVTFTTKATVADTWPVPMKHRMTGRPGHWWCAGIEKTSGAALANAWSLTAKLNQSNQLELTFQGLEASTEYRARIMYE